MKSLKGGYNRMEDNLDIPLAEPKSLFDTEKYEGYSTKIEKVEKREVDDHYIGPNGTWVANTTAKKWVIEISTYPLKELDENGKPTDKDVEFIDEKGQSKKWRVNAWLGLQKDKEGNVVISKHKKAKLWQFMRNKGVEKVSELKDKKVTLTPVASKVEGDERKFLRIVGTF